MTLLSIENLDVRYGQFKAVRSVSLKVGAGEVVAMIGANGAGKTTLLRTLAGAIRPTSGRILFKDKDVTALSAHERVKSGMVLVPEGRRLFARMTVEENLQLGGLVKRGGDWSVDRIFSIFPNLVKRRHAKTGTLSGGEQQATAIGRALMTNPDVIFFDEISLGLSPLVVDQVYASLAELLKSGVTVVLVEQDLKRAMAVAGRAICMLEGQVVLDRTMAETSRDEITEAYFGLKRGQRHDHGHGMGEHTDAEPDRPSHRPRRLLCADRLRAVLHAVGDARHQSGAWQPSRPRRLLPLVSRRALRGLALCRLLALVPLLVLAGWALQRFLLERSARGGELLPILTTFGLSIVLDNLLFEQFGADTRSLAPYIGDMAWDSFELPGGIFVGQIGVLTLAAAIVLLGGLQLFLSRTGTGKAIRATAEDPDTAGIVGIDARRASAIASAIAVGSIGIASAALGMRATFDAYSGGAQLLFAFEATIIGGAGSLWGTLIGGIVLALAQAAGAAIHPQGFLIGGHLAFILVLFARFLFLPGEFTYRLRRIAGLAK